MDSGGVIWVLDGCPSDELAPGDFIGATLALTIDASFITKSPGSTSRSVTVMLFGIPNAGSKLEKEIVSGAAQIVLYAASPAAWAIAPRISDYFASSAKGCFVFWGDSLGSSISFDMGPQVGFMWTDGRLTDDMIKLNSLTSPQTTYRIIENIREKPYTQTAKEAPDPLVLPAAALFAFDSAGLLPSSIQLLTQLKSWFEVNARLGYNGKQRVFLVEGYASRDAPNRESHDLRLSFNRANAIRAWILQSTRLRPDQVQHFGYGQEYPVAPNTTRENREKNRRVRIVVKDQ
jgi:outer membrane protein OmpA-like peptidoglycan-associated protein